MIKFDGKALVTSLLCLLLAMFSLFLLPFTFLMSLIDHEFLIVMEGLRINYLCLAS